MPIFEYRCDDCGHVTKFLEKAGSSKKHNCESCEGSNLQKLLSGFAVGRSSASSQACETCPSGPCPSDFCQAGGCPGGM